MYAGESQMVGPENLGAVKAAILAVSIWHTLPLWQSLAHHRGGPRVPLPGEHVAFGHHRCGVRATSPIIGAVRVTCASPITSIADKIVRGCGPITRDAAPPRWTPRAKWGGDDWRGPRSTKNVGHGRARWDGSLPFLSRARSRGPRPHPVAISNSGHIPL